MTANLDVELSVEQLAARAHDVAADLRPPVPGRDRHDAAPLAGRPARAAGPAPAGVQRRTGGAGGPAQRLRATPRTSGTTSRWSAARRRARLPPYLPPRRLAPAGRRSGVETGGVQASTGAGSRSVRRGAAGRWHEPVADVAHGADQRLVLGAELGPQPPHVDVDRPGAPEVVVAPDLLQQLGPGEDPARVLGQVLQQLELLVGQVQRPGPRTRAVYAASSIDSVAGPDLRRAVVVRRGLDRPTASRSRASTSAGPPLSSSTSSTPHSAVTPARPPSVTIDHQRGGHAPWCAAAGTASGSGPARGGRRPARRRTAGSRRSAEASAGSTRTWWPSRARAGRTWALGSSALVRRRSWATI